MNVLALNAGSSSLKFGVHRVDAAGEECLRSGEAASIAQIVREIGGAHPLVVNAVGHRIVHGGPRLRAPCRVDEGVLREVEAAAAFAPLHVPAALTLLREAREQFPAVPHVLCFDTGFHASLPDVARVLPLPRALRDEGVQRYGFHGLSCESIVHRLGAELPPRLVIAHLGHGASVTAIRDGRSIDTSMGLTPTGGLVMGTRSGDLDPGVLLYFLRERGLYAGAVAHMIDRESGLLGISGVSGDLRQLHEAAPANADARLAIDIFCRSAAKHVAAMMVALDGADLLVFTGGIGENDTAVRDAICTDLAWLGVGGAQARCAVRVMPAMEEAQIARHAADVLRDA